MPQVIPLQALASQTAQCQVNGQAVTLNIYQQAYGLYMDVFIGTQDIVQGIICLNKTLIIRNSYFGFSGDFIFLDVQGGASPTDPVYTGIGTRYFLIYLTPEAIAALNLPTGVE